MYAFSYAWFPGQDSIFHSLHKHQNFKELSALSIQCASRKASVRLFLEMISADHKWVLNTTWIHTHKINTQKMKVQKCLLRTQIILCVLKLIPQNSVSQFHISSSLEIIRQVRIFIVKWVRLWYWSGCIFQVEW